MNATERYLSQMDKVPENESLLRPRHGIAGTINAMSSHDVILLTLILANPTKYGYTEADMQKLTSIMENFGRKP